MKIRIESINLYFKNNCVLKYVYYILNVYKALLCFLGYNAFQASFF